MGDSETGAAPAPIPSVLGGKKYRHLKVRSSIHDQLYIIKRGSERSVSDTLQRLLDMFYDQNPEGFDPDPRAKRAAAEAASRLLLEATRKVSEAKGPIGPFTEDELKELINETNTTNPAPQ